MLCADVIKRGIKKALIKKSCGVEMNYFRTVLEDFCISNVHGHKSLSHARHLKCTFLKRQLVFFFLEHFVALLKLACAFLL